MLLWATENVVVGYVWPACPYLPTPVQDDNAVCEISKHACGKRT